MLIFLTTGMEIIVEFTHRADIVKYFSEELGLKGL